MEITINKDDYEIVRDNLDYPGKTLLKSEDDVVFVVPENFTDEQIWICLEICNSAYIGGYKDGTASKLRQIKEVLEIEDFD